MELAWQGQRPIVYGLDILIARPLANNVLQMESGMAEGTELSQGHQVVPVCVPPAVSGPDPWGLLLFSLLQSVASSSSGHM